MNSKEEPLTPWGTFLGWLFLDQTQELFCQIKHVLDLLELECWHDNGLILLCQLLALRNKSTQQNRCWLGESAKTMKFSRSWSCQHPYNGSDFQLSIKTKIVR